MMFQKHLAMPFSRQTPLFNDSQGVSKTKTSTKAAFVEICKNNFSVLKSSLVVLEKFEKLKIVEFNIAMDSIHA